MRLWYVLLVLAACITALTPLAYASPPDPSWIEGMYDGDDFDHVVVTITSFVGAVVSLPLCDVAPSQVAVASATPADESAVSTPAFSSPHTRAPPASYNKSLLAA